MTIPSNTLSVSAIKDGTVIDHIPEGVALTLVRLLRLSECKEAITIGLHLKSHRMGFKDLIKIQTKALSEKEAHQIAVFAPGATINIIENYKIIKKMKATLPEKIENLLVCPNRACITNFEPSSTVFIVKELKDRIELMCLYCQKEFLKDPCHFTEIKGYKE